MRDHGLEIQQRRQCHVTAALIGIGGALTGGALTGGAAATVGALAVATTVATTGLSIASAVGAFDKGIPKPPGFAKDDQAAAKSRERTNLSREAAEGRNIFAKNALGRNTKFTQPTVLGPVGAPKADQ